MAQRLQLVKRKVIEMKTKLLALMFLVGSAAFAGPRWFVGVGVRVPYAPPPPPIVAYAPPAPGPGYYWVNGYYVPAGPRYVWRAGYWARPPYVGAYWVGPRYWGHRYYHGYWRR